MTVDTEELHADLRELAKAPRLRPLVAEHRTDVEVPLGETGGHGAVERVLDSHGLPRSLAEAPLEYLARILRELEVRESAVGTLTRLFEYARFSPHEIGPELKDDAIAALVAVRTDLVAPETAAA